jgi:hypothetical protein
MIIHRMRLLFDTIFQRVLSMNYNFFRFGFVLHKMFNIREINF